MILDKIIVFGFVAKLCPAIENSSMSLNTSETSFNTSVYITCRAGYVLEDDTTTTTIRCTETGRWSQENVFCTGSYEYLAHFHTVVTVWNQISVTCNFNVILALLGRMQLNLTQLNLSIRMLPNCYLLLFFNLTACDCIFFHSNRLRPTRGSDERCDRRPEQDLYQPGLAFVSTWLLVCGGNTEASLHMSLQWNLVVHPWLLW